MAQHGLYSENMGKSCFPDAIPHAVYLHFDEHVALLIWRNPNVSNTLFCGIQPDTDYGMCAQPYKCANKQVDHGGSACE